MDLRDKTGLLIDDVPEMRTTVRIQLADSGLEKCDLARSVKEAIDRLSSSRYDFILCDYNLGQGADGQQFLELLRRKNLLPLTTAFVVITGESGYEQVSTAAEYAPDDYLLKPFTAETMRARIVRILEKKEALQPLYRHLGEKGDSVRALAVCDELLAQNTRYSLDVLRIKGELLLATRRTDEALALYEGILQQRATPWAAVGKARALAADGDEEEAKAHLTRALEAYPNYLAAYESLAALLEGTDKVAAQRVVEQALKVAPSTERQRRLGGLALANEDYPRAELAFRTAVEKDRTGFFKSHDDYAGLARSYVAQGKSMEALATAREMGLAFPKSPELTARQAAVECQVHARIGNEDAAKAALSKALAVAGSLDPAAALDVALACFACGNEDKARAIIQSVAEDHHEDAAVLARAQETFVAAGRKEEGTAFLEAARRNMIKLNNDAVALAKAGELDKAVAMLGEAAERLPKNCLVAINAAQALLMHIEKNGPSAERLAKAQAYILQARRANPEHPRLTGVCDYYRRIAPPGSPILEE